jgi:hypothetical protein
MERGPLTLFGAIVAVGLGPALYLGAQLGSVNVAPNERPSTVGEQYPEVDDMDFGGVGAGETPDQADWIPSGPDRTTVPATPSRPVTPSASSSSAVVIPPSSPPVSPSPSISASPSPAPSVSDPVVSPSPSADESTSADPEPSGSPSEPVDPELPEPPAEDGGGLPVPSFVTGYE